VKLQRAALLSSVSKSSARAIGTTDAERALVYSYITLSISDETCTKHASRSTTSVHTVTVMLSLLFYLPNFPDSEETCKTPASLGTKHADVSAIRCFHCTIPALCLVYLVSLPIAEEHNYGFQLLARKKSFSPPCSPARTRTD